MFRMSVSLDSVRGPVPLPSPFLVFYATTAFPIAYHTLKIKLTCPIFFFFPFHNMPITPAAPQSSLNGLAHCASSSPLYVIWGGKSLSSIIAIMGPVRPLYFQLFWNTDNA